MMKKFDFKDIKEKLKTFRETYLKKINDLGKSVSGLGKNIANVKTSVSKNEKLKHTLFILRPLTAALLVLCTFMVGGVMGIGMNLSSMQDVKALRYYMPNQTTFIYDDKGEVMAKLHDEENRVVIPLYKIPRLMRQAVLAIEDNRFFSHTGVDLFGILRALKHNAEDTKTGVEGGSTLTQQLAKNLFLSPERSISRKLAEAWLATQIEKNYTKQEIMELYFNQVYWGHNAYGIEAAAQNYFGKSTEKLSLEEEAMLAGLLRAPENFSPFRNFKLAKWRQKLVLQKMAEDKYITVQEAQEAAQKPLNLNKIKYEYKHPYFTTYVIDTLTKKYGSHLRLNGLKVYTTINSKWQTYAEKSFPERIKELKYNNVEQGALICIDPRTGHVKTMMGGTDFKQSQFNRAFQAQRQPGSSFKPFTYLTAFASGYSPSDVEIDGPVTFGQGDYKYSPKNYAGKYSGAMTLRSAVVHSVNIVAVKILDKVGIQNVINTARALGISSDLPPYLSLTLGCASVTPLEMASAYGVFATGGMRVAPTPILYIKDSFGKIIEDNRKPIPARVYNKDAISILVDVLKDVPIWGTAYAARLADRISAGKTGTAENHKDVWYIGFIPQLVTAVWIGNDTPRPIWGATGGYFCAPIWRDFMTFATKDMPVMNFTAPTTFRLTKDLLKNNEKKQYSVTLSEASASPTPGKYGQPAPEISFVPFDRKAPAATHETKQKQEQIQIPVPEHIPNANNQQQTKEELNKMIDDLNNEKTN